MSEMVNVGKDGMIRAKLDVIITAEVEDGRTQIPLEEAKAMIQSEIDYLSESNDGSEMIANADFSLI